MKYSKPMLTAVANATETVRGGKTRMIVQDSAPPYLINATALAYEADE